MSAGQPKISDNTIRRLKSGWAIELKFSEDAFLEKSRVLIPREDLLSVTTLQFQQSIIVVCPPQLEQLLRPLTETQLLDIRILEQILKPYQPIPIGTATISYAERGTLAEQSREINARSARPEEVIEIMSHCTPDEQEESGLDQMPFRFASQSSNGKTAALSGYEIWNPHMAHVGVLTEPQMRGQGFGFAAAAMSAAAALDSDLIPQWRCRVDNTASQRLGYQLGFMKLGVQLALEVSLS